MYAKCLPKEVNNAYVFTQLVLKVNRYCAGGFTYFTVLYILLTLHRTKELMWAIPCQRISTFANNLHKNTVPAGKYRTLHVVNLLPE